MHLKYMLSFNNNKNIYNRLGGKFGISRAGAFFSLLKGVNKEKAIEKQN